MCAKKTLSILLKRFLKKEIGNSKRVFDIGCGEGVIAFNLISSLNCCVDGIDLDKGKVHNTNKKFRKRLTKGLASCCLCDANDINKKFKKETYDVVLIIHTLHHLTNLSGILIKSRYLLKYGGKIFIGEYQRDYGEKLDNCPRFSSKKIKSMLKTARFTKIKSNNIHKNFVMISAIK